MLAKSARFTQRFEDRIGHLCREMSIKRVAELNNLSWDQVCRMEKWYMRRLLEQNPPTVQLRSIGMDEISIRKGHTYAIWSPILIRSDLSGWAEKAEPKRIYSASSMPWGLIAAKQ